MAIRRILVPVVLLFTLTACGGKPTSTVSTTAEKSKSSPAPSAPTTTGNVKELIIGKWVLTKGREPQIEWPSLAGQPEKAGSLEITKAGDIKVLIPNPENDVRKSFYSQRKYKFTGEDAIVVTPVGGLGALEGAGEKMPKTVKVKATADELTLTDDQGKTDKYQRSK